jgi:hypothetical protein
MAASVSSRRLAASVLVLSVPGVAHWLIGDLSEGDDPLRLDYFLRPTLSASASRILGWVSLGAFFLAALFLWRSARSRPLTRAWKWVVALLMVVGLIVAAGYRVMTAGVGGANIGAGLFLMFGVPACVALLVGAASIAVRARRSTSGRHFPARDASPPRAPAADNMRES